MWLLKSLIVVVLLGCAGEGKSVAWVDDSTHVTRVRDSAGLAIVENRPNSANNWFIDTLTVTTFGARTAADQFSEVVGGAILPSGDVLIADAREGNVRLFDSHGTMLRVVVGKGRGPEELPSITRMLATRLDSLYVVGGQERSIAVLDPSARVARKIRDYEFRPDSVRNGLLATKVVGVLDDGSIVTGEERSVVLNSVPEAPEPGSPRGRRGLPPLPILVFRRGAPGESLLADIGSPPQPARESQDGRSVMQNPVVALAIGNDLLYSPADTLAIFRYSSTGKLTQIFGISRARLPVPNWSKPSWATTDLPPFMPDVLTLVSDDEARIWVGSFELAGKDAIMQSWFVFRPDGALDLTVHSKVALKIVAVRGDRVLAIHTSSDEVPIVQLYRLRRV
jgi:hypothetical protein